VRTLEWLLLATVAARILAMLLRGESGAMWRGVAAVAAGATLVAHLALEGPRWSMAATYAAVALAVVLLPWERPHPKAVLLRMGRNRRLRRPLPWGRVLLALLLWAPMAAVPVLLPVPTLPAPTGPWAVGSLSFALSLPDTTRPDGGVEADRRTMVRVWYPVDPSLGLPADAPWIERADAVLPAMARSAGLPRFVFDHLALVRTHAAWAAPLAPAPPGGWPLATFAHGLGGFRSQNTFLAEDLASHGVVVAALDHPGDALATTLPDGTTLPYVGLPPAEAPGYVAAVVAMGARWTADTLALLRTLEALLPVGDLAAFAGELDLERVVAMGHAAGGGVAVETCHAWDGCRAVLALDPWWAVLAPVRLERGSDRPLVVVASDPALAYFGAANADRFDRLRAASAAPVERVVLSGGGHHDLDDTATLALSSLALRLGHHVGPVDKADSFEAQRELALALLNATAADAEFQASTVRSAVKSPLLVDAGHGAD